MKVMENLYHEDVVIFFSIEMLEGILELFKHADQFKGGGHKIMSLGNLEFVFSSDECLVREQRGDTPSSEKTPPSGNTSPSGEEQKRRCTPLFNNKNVNDEQELIAEEIAKCLYGEGNHAQGEHKRKLVTALVIQAILFANRIGLDVYKLNLFLSIILMTMHKIRDNLKEKKGRKKKTINYFFHLMNKNVHYGLVEDPIGERDLKRDVPQQGACTYVEGESHSLNGQHFVKPSNRVGSKEGEDTTSTTQPISVNIKQKAAEDEEDAHDANGMSVSETGKKQTEDPLIPLEEDGHRQVCERFILFHFEEAKNIMKYTFEHIFCIYNIIEYLFLFSPEFVHVAYGGGFSPASPPKCLFTSDGLKLGEAANMNDENMVDHFDGTEDEELATNIYIKEALDVPLFVLNKFYSNVDQLGRKMDQLLV
ncbi:hypothetical protein AK88_04386 [Plasmodium fragile]|uniref:Uncharacterized protein n=1 Tax=Plasmodium fragile TaxID=5857 RepID=A0A0D9QGM8_PLAFR|nr:uncharacterized protein AK88_04386 [Plasmodium fragile]KJP85977.1 hypothetical protein AK88_04386 [Plasmodium fragile]